MIEFLNAMSAVFVLIMIMAVGYGMGHIGWIGTSEKQFLSKYILNIAVPCLCISGVLNNLKRDMLMEMSVMFLMSLVSIVLMLLLATLIAFWLRLPKKQKGVFIAMCAFSNTLFIGLPVSTQLFGDECVPYVMVYYIASTILVQLVGVLLVERAGSVKKQSSGKEIVKSIFTKPPILGVITAMFLLLSGLMMPDIIMRFTGYIGNTVSPLALIYCGYILYEIGIRNLRLQKGFGAMLLCRLIVAPAICLGLCVLARVEIFPRSVLLIESALPVVTQVSVMCGAYGADEQYAVSGSCISIFGAFVTIPVWMVILG